MQINVEIISVGVTVTGETRRGRDYFLAAHPRQPPLLLFVFDDISVAVFCFCFFLICESQREICSHSVQLLLLETQEEVFHSTKKENFLQK